MARRRRRWQKVRPLPGDPSDPQGLLAWTLRYLEAAQTKHFTPQTLRTKRKSLSLFLSWCETRGLTRPTAITRPHLLRYQRHLFLYRKADGKPLSVGTQRTRLTTLKGFFQWLTREHAILSNPAADLDLPKRPPRLPKHVLTPEEVEHVLAQPDTNELLGIRDRAILELLYATGLRRMEVVALGLYDLEPSRQVLRVREGKGGRERVVPVGFRALSWCQRYLAEVRPELRVPPDPERFFLTVTGEGFSLTGFGQTVRRHLVAAGLGGRGSCHLFRHTCATLMLENGADIRYIQEMLGHAKLSTTEIYTRVSIRKLQEVHAATHPAAQLREEGAHDE